MPVFSLWAITPQLLRGVNFKYHIYKLRVITHPDNFRVLRLSMKHSILIEGYETGMNAGREYLIPTQVTSKCRFQSGDTVLSSRKIT